MAAAPFAHFVFVDFENCPKLDLSLVAGQPVHVTVLIGKNQSKLPSELALDLHALGSQVRPVKLEDSGRNALDFTLAYCLGRTAEQWPDAELHVVSKDRDYDPLLRHLVATGIRASRSNAFEDLPFLGARKPPARNRPASKKKTLPPPVDPLAGRSAEIMARLSSPANRNRPATATRLRAYIKANLGNQPSEAQVENLVRALSDHGVLTLTENGRVKYTAFEATTARPAGRDA